MLYSYLGPGRLQICSSNVCYSTHPAHIMSAVCTVSLFKATYCTCVTVKEYGDTCPFLLCSSSPIPLSLPSPSLPLPPSLVLQEGRCDGRAVLLCPHVDLSVPCPWRHLLLCTLLPLHLLRPQGTYVLHTDTLTQTDRQTDRQITLQMFPNCG